MFSSKFFYKALLLEPKHLLYSYSVLNFIPSFSTIPVYMQLDKYSNYYSQSFGYLVF